MTMVQIQHLLAYLGYYTIPVDGVSGPKTRDAIEAFQKAFGGLSADGVAGSETQKALKHAVAYGIETKPPAESDENQNGSSEDDFWNGIPNFSEKEFACKCPRCGGFPVSINHTLVSIVQRIRTHFKAPVIISSGVRCEEHNREVGGVANSYHVRGKACDFCVQGFSASSVLPYVKSLKEVHYTYAIDNDYVHVDVF